jgi:hypothetical protein
MLMLSLVDAQPGYEEITENGEDRDGKSLNGHLYPASPVAEREMEIPRTVEKDLMAVSEPDSVEFDFSPARASSSIKAKKSKTKNPTISPW